jgi:hypothetical protein
MIHLSKYSINPDADVLDLIWLAGFIDGEGSLIFKDNNKSLIPKISVSNTHLPTIDIIKNILNRNKIKFSSYPKKGKTKATGVKHSNSIEIYVENKHCEPLLKLLLPYLRTKKEQARLILKLLKGNKKNRDYDLTKLALIEDVMLLNKTNQTTKKYGRLLELRKKVQKSTENFENLPETSDPPRESP